VQLQRILPLCEVYRDRCVDLSRVSRHGACASLRDLSLLAEWVETGHVRDGEKRTLPSFKVVRTGAMRSQAGVT
jgi:hypothetical protein